MKPTTERLGEAIRSYVNEQFTIGRQSCDILGELLGGFGLTESELCEIGLDYLLPEKEEKEEEPIQEFGIHYSELRSATYIVYARNAEEAEREFKRRLEENDLDLDRLDVVSDWYELID